MFRSIVSIASLDCFDGSCTNECTDECTDLCFFGRHLVSGQPVGFVAAGAAAAAAEQAFEGRSPVVCSDGGTCVLYELLS